MARTQITANAQEAMGLMAECRVRARPYPDPTRGGGTFVLPLVDPAGQEFDVLIQPTASPGLSGNILTINAGLRITAEREE